MSIIASVDTATIRIPLPQSITFSSRTVAAREYTVVRITTDDGITGIGFCYPGHAGANISTLAVADLLAPTIVGSDVHDIERLWRRMYQEVLLHGRVGSVMRALSAIDIALWDAKAKTLGIPLHKLMGGNSDTVEAYASGGYYKEGKGISELVDEVVRHVDNGFKALKIKVGRVSVKEDTERIAAVRDAIGSEVNLLLDANNAFTDLPSALKAVEAWADYNPYFIEEPFSPDDIINHRRLSQATNIPVATGEIEAGRWRTKEILDHEAAIILQHDAGVCGGFSELQKIAHLAAAYGVKLCPHWFHDLHAPFAGAFANVQYIEYFSGTEVSNISTVLTRQLRVENGQIHLHQEPGLGFDFDMEKLAPYVRSAWTTISNQS